MNNSPQPEEAIVDAALALPPGERAAYVDKVCAQNARLRQMVEALLCAHQHIPPLTPAKASPRASEPTIALSIPLTEKSGDRIGRYKILQQIGEGGCGVVYMAEQEEPVRRRIALKVIKLGMDTKQVIARFEAERQALALMDHPNIAKVLDAGAAENGRPFFVMELVRGIKITQYCDQNHLSTPQRLNLFTQVCLAIQHAHQKGIIHRDIKPSNILVADHDGVPVPKIIDFGIAKATDQRLTDKTLFTAFEQFIGTPAYMSPEQAQLSGLDIDTRSDIYSLGVLLYELLTGKTPFDAKRLVESGFDELRRIIREEEPARPSARLSTLAVEEQTTVAKRRHSEPPKLFGLIRGDLDWIVMKALEKDRNRRYATANGLAMDIERHLKDEPVTAVAPSKLYKFQKFARRNKSSFAAISVIALLLVVGIIDSTWFAIHSNRLRKAADHSKAEELKANVELRNQRDLTRDVAARFQLQKAEDLFAADASKALATLARVLHDQPTNRVVAERLLNALAQRSFLVPTALPFPEGTALARWSPDGKSIVTALSALEGSSVRVYERGGKPIAELLKSTAPVKCLNISNDGSLVATASEDRIRVGVVSLMTTSFDRMNTNHGARAVKLLPQGKLLVVSGNAVELWQLDGALLHELRIQPGLALQMALNIPSGLLAVADDTSTLRICRLESLEVLHTIPAAHSKVIRDLQFNADGSQLISAGADSVARTWNTKTGQRSLELRHAAPVYFAEFSPDGSRIATASRDETAQLWNLAGEKAGPPMQHQNSVNTARFSSDGRQLLTASDDGTVRQWDVSNSIEVGEPARFDHPVSDASFSPDGNEVLVSIADASARILARTAGLMFQVTNAPPPAATPAVGEAEMAAFARKHASGITFIDASPDGNWVVTASADKTARVWNRKKQEPVGERLPHDAAVNCARFSPDSKRVVTSTSRRTVRVWDSATGAPLCDGFDSDSPVSSVWFVADGSAVLTDSGLAFPTFVVRGGVPSSLPSLAEAVAGVRYTSEWIEKSVPPSAFLELKAQLEASPATEPVELFLKKFVASTKPKPKTVVRSQPTLSQ